MKQIYFTLLLAVMSLFTSQTANAYDFEVDGIYYNLITEDFSAQVTHGDIPYSGNITIPSNIIYKGRVMSVKSIGDNAFYENQDLISVNIGEGITYIASKAFVYCTNLTSVSFPSSLSTIGSYAFARCSSLSTIELPNTLKEIGTGAFTDCSNITKILFPDSLSNIPDQAFAFCNSLSDISFPANIKGIGDIAFYSCKSIKALSIPNTITHISQTAFAACNLDSVIINNRGGISITSDYNLSSGFYIMDHGNQKSYDQISLKFAA